MSSVSCVVALPDGTAWKLRDYVRRHPELIFDEYQTGEEQSLNGGCYLLSECYFHSNGGTKSGLTIHCLSWDDVVEHETGATHWFLRDGETVIDLGLDSLEQADEIPYHAATRRAFITGYEPSQRAKDVLEALDLRAAHCRNGGG